VGGLELSHSLSAGFLCAGIPSKPDPTPGPIPGGCMGKSGLVTCIRELAEFAGQTPALLGLAGLGGSLPMEDPQARIPGQIPAEENKRATSSGR